MEEVGTSMSIYASLLVGKGLKGIVIIANEVHVDPWPGYMYLHAILCPVHDHGKKYMYM